MGGVTAATPDSLLLMNGLSDKFWGWGGEDDDMELRARNAGLKHMLVPLARGRYRHIPHGKSWKNPRRLVSYYL